MKNNLYSSENTEKLDIAEFVEGAYLNYSMYVILDRALPHISDGLKPVQRRIIYAMSELGLKASAKYKKSARTIGDVLGKFHPHGDSACYEAMVLMAQNFSLRYPLIDGQGNWGSIDDPKSFAAMRYTEARLSKFAQSLLSEIEQGTVDWVPNFDASLDEPSFLPSKLPHILLNGTSGIAVGMSTDIPPHNVGEIVDSCLYLLNLPKAKKPDLDEILDIVQGPDYPTGGIIVSNQSEIKEIYQTGSGSIRLRSFYQSQGNDIVITELPFQTSIVKIMEQLAAQIQAKKLPWVKNIRDESDEKSQVRLVIELKAKTDTDALMNHLFASTDLEKNYRIHMNMIGLNKKPKCKSLIEILTQWLDFRTQTTQRRLQFLADQLNDRLHLLEGLLIAYLNIDEVIQIIRFEDNPKEILIERFNITPLQATAILEMKLRNLAKLEEIKIKKEQQELNSQLDEINHHLSSEKNLKKLVAQELKVVGQEFNDKRRTRLQSAAVPKAFESSEILPSYDLTVVLSQKGWVKVIKSKDIQIDEIKFQEGDQYLIHTSGKSNLEVSFLDNFGNSFSIKADSLVNSSQNKSSKGIGEPVNKYFNVNSQVQFISCQLSDLTDQYLLVAKKGYGFITESQNFLTRMKSGKALISLGNKKDPNSNSPLVPQKIAPNDEYVALLSKKGKLLIIELNDIPSLNKGKGNKLIGLDKQEDDLMSMALLSKQDSLKLIIQSKSKILKPNDWVEYVSKRALKGKKLPKPFQSTQSLFALKNEKGSFEIKTAQEGADKPTKMNSLFD